MRRELDPQDAELAKIVVPAAWQALEATVQPGDTVLVVGASDTGKSTLARWLYQRLCLRLEGVAYLDADVGQSRLGAPATMTVALSAGSGARHFPPQGPWAAYFVGHVSPRGHFLPMVLGVHRLQTWALARAAGAVVVDTTGLVDLHQGGVALKHAKIELLQPSLVVGLGGPELAPLLLPVSLGGPAQVISLPPSPHVEARAREARFRHRRARWVGYFQTAALHTFSLAQMPVFGAERLRSGQVLGLQDAQGFLLGVGVLESWDRHASRVVVRAPVGPDALVASLRVGALGLDPQTGIENRS
jgi:polynucleotide 5'-hydroxyl-kinase GRC3/NOL9